jgi:hypothetical protein
MSKIIVYTCLFGNTDKLQEPVGHFYDTDFVCFTDNKKLQHTKNWIMSYLPATNQPTRRSRNMKWSAEELFPGQTTLWMDASFKLMTDPQTIEQSFREDFYRFKHPDRSRITDEAEEIVKRGKAERETIDRQLLEYKLHDFDCDNSKQQVLSCNGVLLRRPTEMNARLNAMMREQFLKFTLRDQMALDYCAYRLGAQLHFWPGHHRNNPHFTYVHFNRPTNDF